MAITRAVASSITQGLPKNKTLLAGNSTILPGSYESIQTVTVGAGGAATVSFTSIPSTYKHLQIRCSMLQTSSTDIFIKLNADNGNRNHYLAGNGTTAYAGSDIAPGSNGQYFGNVGSGTTYPMASVTDILDYTNANKNITVRSLGGVENNSGTTSSRVWLYSFLFSATSVVTSVTFTSGSTFAQYSSFALYGIK